jgi:mRNA interferase HigB
VERTRRNLLPVFCAGPPAAGNRAGDRPEEVGHTFCRSRILRDFVGNFHVASVTYQLATYLKTRYNPLMHIITRKTLILFWEKYPDSQTALLRWFKIVQKTEFNNFAELRRVFPSADKLDHWIIFNIGGNKYKLITSIHFNRGNVYIRDVLTHAEYDRGDWKNDSRK